MNCRTEVWLPALSAISPTCFLTASEGNLSLVSKPTVPRPVSGHWETRKEHKYSMNLYMLVLSMKVTRRFSPRKFLCSMRMYKYFDYILRWTMTFQNKIVLISLHQRLLLPGPSAATAVSLFSLLNVMEMFPCHCSDSHKWYDQVIITGSMHENWETGNLLELGRRHVLARNEDTSFWFLDLFLNYTFTFASSWAKMFIEAVHLFLLFHYCVLGN